MIFKLIGTIILIGINFFIQYSLETKKLRIALVVVTLLLLAGILVGHYIETKLDNRILSLSILIIPIYFINLLIDSILTPKEGIQGAIREVQGFMRKRFLIVAITLFQLMILWNAIPENT